MITLISSEWKTFQVRWRRQGRGQEFRAISPWWPMGIIKQRQCMILAPKSNFFFKHRTIVAYLCGYKSWRWTYFIKSWSAKLWIRLDKLFQQKLHNNHNELVISFLQSALRITHAFCKRLGASEPHYSEIHVKRAFLPSKNVNTMKLQLARIKTSPSAAATCIVQLSEHFSRD